MFNPIGLLESEIYDYLSKHGISNSKMRAQQIYHWIYRKGSTDINLSNLGNEVKQLISIELPKITKELTSVDGTKKFLLTLTDQEKIEAVLIPAGNRTTLCASSQVGCKMGCKFCNTAMQGFSRDLSTAEIIVQYLLITNLGYNITNIVFMGMGEPLNNFNNLSKAIAILTDPQAFGISKQKITISTSGVIPGIKLLQSLKLPLAVSLHAADDAKRSKIMPINHMYPISHLIKAIKEYKTVTNVKKVTIEYMMIDKFNDTKEDAKNLIRILSNTGIKVNLIPFNDWGHKFFRPSKEEAILDFQKMLKIKKIQCNIRKSMGHDIMAACGELKAKTT